MKTATTLAAIVGLLSTLTEAINLQERVNEELRVVSFDIERRVVKNPVARDRLRRRTTTLQASLDNEETLYYINATLGTPPQSLRLHIDTGSSDLWVNTPTSAICKGTGACTSTGTYSANSSSTYEYISSSFNISYVDGTGAAGDYVSDTFTVGGTNITDLQFGIGYKSSSPQGILGVGYEINEVQFGRSGQSYENLPAKLVSEGFIQSNAYSLWLNDLDASTGSILFGGVDTAKYSGTLETLPIQKEYGYFAEFLITLTGVTLDGKVMGSDEKLAVLLDSGTSLTYLPDMVTQNIFDQVGAEYDANIGAAYVDCSLASNTSTLKFTFGTPVISIAMSELVLDTGEQLQFTDGSAACLFGVAPAGSSTATLGDSFLRSAYVVYDLANDEISLAQTVYNVTTSNIKEITTGTSSVPNAALVSNAPTATALSSGTSGIDSTTTTINNASGAIIAVAPIGIMSLLGAGAAIFASI